MLGGGCVQPQLSWRKQATPGGAVAPSAEYDFCAVVDFVSRLIPSRLAGDDTRNALANPCQSFMGEGFVCGLGLIVDGVLGPML